MLWNPVPLSPSSDEGEWQKLQPQTLVNRTVEAVISQAARGLILPGDRIVEADLARKFGVSRAPVLEALRLLESSGITVNQPYKSIRLRPLKNRWVHDLVEARTALETSAAHRAVDVGRHRGEWIIPLVDAIKQMDQTASRGDAYEVVLGHCASSTAK